MASLALRTAAFLHVKRVISRPVVRCMAAAREGGGIADTFDHATGLEKKELEAIRAGNPDPFDLQVKHCSPGTRDAPIEVPSVFEKRVVGCICEEEMTHVNWFNLYSGEPQRCECGHFFKLTKRDPIQ
ncbi:cytochrome c oxidase subunit 5B, mitochondrial-like [Anneissia japonica]|uniref:cytochrome c oxidase subunit 5B, mitochondrial-like n=1 Tax=Anneissia japonica TaxID=1529436 RepID=UPI00142593F6|nr:cytochrome c oxidase subunit 5B, mitochondrial-like [Anneissia japonica]